MDTPYRNNNPDYGTESKSNKRFDYGPGEYRDKPFLFGFIVHLIVIVAAAGVYGGDFLNSIDKDDTAGGDLDVDQNVLLAIVIVCAILAAVFAAGWLQIMQMYSNRLIYYSLVGMGCVLATLAGVSLIMGVVGMAFILFLFLGLGVLYYHCVKDRIAFAEAVLHEATSALKDNWSVILFTYLTTAIEIVWIALWIFTFASVAHAMNLGDESVDPVTGESVISQPSGLQSLAVFGLLVSFYWTSQVLKNIGHVTTAGAIASWWFQPSAPSPAYPAFKRACSTSLGSICFGSLIVAVLQAMRAMLRQARSNGRNNLGAACAECILNCIEGLIRYFNIYAFTQVAIYGKDFVTAAKDTWELFQQRGFEIIINDDLTGFPVTIGCIVGALLITVVSVVWAMSAGFPSEWVMGVGLVCFMIGFAIVALTLTVVESAVATTFVVWAEDPAALERSRPEAFGKITEASQMRYQRSFANGVL